MKPLIIGLLGLLLLAIVLALSIIWLNRLQVCTPSLLVKVQIKRLSAIHWEIQFQLPMESVYHPRLVASHLEKDRVVVEIHQQIAFGPLQGVLRTLIATSRLFESIPTSIPGTRLYRATLGAFGQETPRFVLHGKGEYLEIPAAAANTSSTSGVPGGGGIGAEADQPASSTVDSNLENSQGAERTSNSRIFPLRLNTDLTLDSITIRLQEVVIDNRCPLGMNCYWPGIFVAKALIQLGKTEKQVLLGYCNGKPALVGAAFNPQNTRYSAGLTPLDDIEIGISALEPARSSADTSINPEDYRLRLTLKKREP